MRANDDVFALLGRALFELMRALWVLAVIIVVPSALGLSLVLLMFAGMSADSLPVAPTVFSLAMIGGGLLLAWSARRQVFPRLPVEFVARSTDGGSSFDVFEGEEGTNAGTGSSKAA